MKKSILDYSFIHNTSRHKLNHPNLSKINRNVVINNYVQFKIRSIENHYLWSSPYIIFRDSCLISSHLHYLILEVRISIIRPF